MLDIDQMMWWLGVVVVAAPALPAAVLGISTLLTWKLQERTIIRAPSLTSWDNLWRKNRRNSRTPT